MFRMKMPEKFYSSRIHTNPKHIPPKTASRNLQQSIGLHGIIGDMDYVHWCKRKTLHFGGLSLLIDYYNYISVITPYTAVTSSSVIFIF
jgi:hypothetical protein